MGWEKGIRQEVSLHPRIKSPVSGAPGTSKGHSGVTLELPAASSPFQSHLSQDGFQLAPVWAARALSAPQDHPDPKKGFRV